MCLTSALPKILTEVETFGERCPVGPLGSCLLTSYCSFSSLYCLFSNQQQVEQLNWVAKIRSKDRKSYFSIWGVVCFEMSIYWFGWLCYLVLAVWHWDVPGLANTIVLAPPFGHTQPFFIEWDKKNENMKYCLKFGILLLNINIVWCQTSFQKLLVSLIVETIRDRIN